MATSTKTFSGSSSLNSFYSNLNSAVNYGNSISGAMKISSAVFSAFGLLGNAAVAYTLSSGSSLLGNYYSTICLAGINAIRVVDDFRNGLLNGSYTDVVMQVNYDYGYDSSNRAFAVLKSVKCIRARKPNGTWIEIA